MQVARKTKIVATAGPACKDAEVMLRMVQAGMDVLRVNLAYSSALDPAEFIATYRAACAQQDREACVCIDLQASELRSSQEQTPGHRAGRCEASSRRRLSSLRSITRTTTT